MANSVSASPSSGLGADTYANAAPCEASLCCALRPSAPLRLYNAVTGGESRATRILRTYVQDKETRDEARPPPGGVGWLRGWVGSASARMHTGCADLPRRHPSLAPWRHGP